MSALLPKTHLSPEEYLYGENDRIDGTRYEYVNGQVYAMADASRNHNLLTGNLFLTLGLHLRGKPCQVFQSDMKVGIKTLSADYFYYPDVQVTCAEEHERYYNTSPCLIIEVLSDSTARTDRTEKLAHYRLLPSLQDYILCSQDFPAVEIYRCRTEWKVERFIAGQSFTLASIQLEVNVIDLYDFLFNPDTNSTAQAS